MEESAPQIGPLILTVNGGSSSIKFAVFAAAALKRVLNGEIERIGAVGTQLTATHQNGSGKDTRAVTAATLQEGAQCVVSYLQEQLGSAALGGIGHRIVHGGLRLRDHQLVTEDVLEELRRAQVLDWAHLPREIALLEAFAAAFPGLPQVACFDTAFHRAMPEVAQLLPIPYRYFAAGVRRLGFHGLSYTYLMQRLAVVAGTEAANGRVILAHLGSGASMAAVRGGKAVDTTMGFTPTSGLVMGTRPGDMDAGLLLYVMREEKLTADEMDRFISETCGLLGVSETSADMRDLLVRRSTDARAAEAVALFCYQAKKFVGALAAALGGLDTLVFSGGIGEHSPEVRAGICEGLESLDVGIDAQRNNAGEDVISAAESRVMVRVIATDEESVIAETVAAILQRQS